MAGQFPDFGAYEICLYCDNDQCQVRGVEVEVKIYTDADRDTVVGTLWPCPVCTRPMKVHEVR